MSSYACGANLVNHQIVKVHMSRERIEDLGRIAVLIDEVLENQLFSEEVILDEVALLSEDKEESEKVRMIRECVERVSEIHEKLHLVREIAYGEDSHNDPMEPKW